MREHYFLFGLALLLFIGCEEPVDIAEPTGNSKEYLLVPGVNPLISGTVTFVEYDDQSTEIIIQLVNKPQEGTFPAYLHINSTAEGGDIVAELNPLEGGVAANSTRLSVLNNSTKITYDELLAFDGHITVNYPGDLSNLILASGDIGENELTGDFQEIELEETDVMGVSGKVTFFERFNSETLAKIELDNVPEDAFYPAHIHENSIAEKGLKIVTLNPVEGPKAISYTNIAAYDDDMPVTYDEIIVLDGHLNVHESAEDLDVYAARANLGVNQLTGQSSTYLLNENSESGVSGTFTIKERVDGSALAILEMQGTSVGFTHPAHIHEGKFDEAGDVAIALNSVIGEAGISYTQIDEFNGSEDVYANLVVFDGSVKLHQSSDDLNTVIAHGDIGSNQSQVIIMEVTNLNSSAYLFYGHGWNNAANPPISLIRGQVYLFVIDAPGHPFYIKYTQTAGSDNAYNDGVTNNGTEDGTITFVVPDDAPDVLYYNCRIHGAMSNVMNVNQ